VLDYRTAATLRFHSASGTRVALRANAIVLGVLVFLVGSAPIPEETLASLVLPLVTARAAIGGRFIFAGLCVLIAERSAARLRPGLVGWMRSLPAGDRRSRRAATIALCLTQFLPVLLVLIGMIWANVEGRAVDAWRITGSVLLMVVSPIAAMSGRSVVARMFGIAAIVGAAFGTFSACAVSILSALLCDRFATLAGYSTRRVHQVSIAKVLERRYSPLAWWIRHAYRAMRGRKVVEALPLPAIFVAFSYLIVRNNPDLDSETARRAAAIGGTLAIMAIAAPLAMPSSLEHRAPSSPSRSCRSTRLRRSHCSASPRLRPSLPPTPFASANRGILVRRAKSL
jgi:hypothetical protein